MTATGWSVNSPFLEAAIQLEFLINGWCAANSRPDLLRAPPAALAEDATVDNPGRQAGRRPELPLALRSVNDRNVVETRRLPLAPLYGQIPR
jgi:hypothetical protein